MISMCQAAMMWSTVLLLFCYFVVSLSNCHLSVGRMKLWPLAGKPVNPVKYVAQTWTFETLRPEKRHCGPILRFNEKYWNKHTVNTVTFFENDNNLIMKTLYIISWSDIQIKNWHPSPRKGCSWRWYLCGCPRVWPSTSTSGLGIPGYLFTLSGEQLCQHLFLSPKTTMPSNWYGTAIEQQSAVQPHRGLRGKW